MPEITLTSYQNDPSILESQLSRFKSADGLEFYTYSHYLDLDRVWERYFDHLKDTFDFAIQPGDVVIDVGAHHGIVALNSARLGAKVFALEPYPINLDVLKRNVALYPQYDITIKAQAAFSKSGPAVFNAGKTSTTGALIDVGRDWKRTQENYEVQCINFEDLFRTYGLKNVKLLKLDCEGGEYDFLLNVSREQFRQVEFYYVETHQTKFYQSAVLEKFIKDQGYKIRFFQEPNGCVELVCLRDG